MNKNLMNLKQIKFVLPSIILILLSTGVFAQKQDAAAAVKSFYSFHFSHEDSFNEKEVALRRRFFTAKLQKLFDAELKRQTIYLKKHPTDKPYFEGLSFQPIEFCPKDYRVGAATAKKQTATVKVNFVYGKSSCAANDGTRLSYKISLAKIGGHWLIDDVIYDDGTTLTEAFGEAQKIK